MLSFMLVNHDSRAFCHPQNMAKIRFIAKNRHNNFTVHSLVLKETQQLLYNDYILPKVRFE